jgi:hypothetical protein
VLAAYCERLLGLRGIKTMNRISQKRMWLAGASLLAILLGSGDADAVLFGVPGSTGYTIPTTGWYDFKVAGANGGPGLSGGSGRGAVVGGELFFGAGDSLGLLVGGGGGNGVNYGNGYGGAGGGGSFVFGAGGGLLFAAAGGGGSSGSGYGGYPAGPASYGGGGGAGTALIGPNQPAYGQTPAQAGSFPNGGAGACCYFGGGPSGGYGGGGGGGFSGPGGGGGAPAGESYVISTARNAFGITGGNMNDNYEFSSGANGYLSIDFVAAPEPSTWAMSLMGFAGLGWLAHLRRRKLTPS